MPHHFQPQQQQQQPRLLASWVVRSAKVGLPALPPLTLHTATHPVAEATSSLARVASPASYDMLLCAASLLLLLLLLVKCAELLQKAKTKYGAKDLMGALKLYEDVLAQVRQAGEGPGGRGGEGGGQGGTQDRTGREACRKGEGRRVQERVRREACAGDGQGGGGQGRGGLERGRAFKAKA